VFYTTKAQDLGYGNTHEAFITAFLMEASMAWHASLGSHCQQYTEGFHNLTFTTITQEIHNHLLADREISFLLIVLKKITCNSL